MEPTVRAMLVLEAVQETLAEYESREDAAAWAAEIETLRAIAKQLRHELAIPEVP